MSDSGRKHESSYIANKNETEERSKPFPAAAVCCELTAPIGGETVEIAVGTGGEDDEDGKVPTTIRIFSSEEAAAGEEEEG